MLVICVERSYICYYKFLHDCTFNKNVLWRQVCNLAMFFFNSCQDNVLFHFSSPLSSERNSKKKNLCRKRLRHMYFSSEFWGELK